MEKLKRRGKRHTEIVHGKWKSYLNWWIKTSMMKTSVRKKVDGTGIINK